MTEKTGIDRIIGAVCDSCNEYKCRKNCLTESAIRKGVAEERLRAVQSHILMGSLGNKLTWNREQAEYLVQLRKEAK